MKITDTNLINAIVALRQCARENEKRPTSTGHICISDLCNDVADFLMEVKDEMTNEFVKDLTNNKWVSVNERLPEIGKSVLVYLKPYGETSIAWRDNCLGMTTEKWRTYNTCTYADDIVSHWRELPENPTDDE